MQNALVSDIIFLAHIFFWQVLIVALIGILPFASRQLQYKGYRLSLLGTTCTTGYALFALLGVGNMKLSVVTTILFFALNISCTTYVPFPLPISYPTRKLFRPGVTMWLRQRILYHSCTALCLLRLNCIWSVSIWSIFLYLTWNFSLVPKCLSFLVDDVLFSGSCFGTSNLLGTRTCDQISTAPFYQFLSVQVKDPDAFYAYRNACYHCSFSDK